MIKKFLRERFSWIFLFLFLQLLFVFIAFIDTAIPLSSILYIVFLSFIIFIFFVIIRYQKETKFYRSLEEWENSLDLTRIPNAESPFEHIIEDSITGQTEMLKKNSSHNLMSLEKEKDELLSWIHEVKTPLTAMSLMIDRLEDEKIKEQLTHEWLRIHLLLDTQLHQKRIPFMENDLYMEKVNLQSLIVKEIKTLQSWCMQKGIGFDMELEVTEVVSDGKWVAFIIRQLLTNAVKYSEASDIFIRTYEQNRHTVLEVKDFGRGIDPKDLPRIFDKGFTSTAEHQDHAATGMGLYLAKKCAKSLLITIDVQSTLGKGTTVTLTFPKRNEFHQIMGV
ncbi:sensor histidine kinase [Heyndrickxia sporothermodurans]|uniref:sensor histidine kinase n=1 Tax=Heyndrickxia sporothermodurans TaxID=46224 RepID=UPI002DB64EB7|nr:sensor histidine kinase [Heyndrickxia sporothermodurans]MEB6549976.1 sensor histidine kinase [Heyndrickxia sporothermodurans]MED3653883.1 sensor histidine kinase [Heyndrickxia sporothermodurans]MED3779896.1 sensor histidine kinase [Heyndrickxia sporothermodurans]